MTIAYREITVNTIAPIGPSIGEIWVKPIGPSTTYQAYIWINAWLAIVSGGVFISETNPDSTFINVVIQEAIPTDLIKPGWIWIKESTSAAYLFIYDFLSLTGA